MVASGSHLAADRSSLSSSAPTGCPLPNTHRRIAQAHRLWHQTLSQYDEPDGFEANLNSAIQSLRTVTFMLQNEKASVPDFDAWYAEWQATMKADAIMKWLSDARTTIVHRADLETHSAARAVIHNNLTIAVREMKVSPFLSTEEIAHLLSKDLPDFIQKDMSDLVLAVERRWCANELPQHELLEALAHAYGLLSRLVRDAHTRAGCDYDTLDQDGHVHETSDGRMPCMVTTKEMRTVRLKLETGRVFAPEGIRVTASQADVEKSVKRYGMRGPLSAGVPKDPFEMAATLVEGAKVMLKKDKYLARTVFLVAGGQIDLVGLKARDRADKYALMRLLAEEVRARQAEAMIDIGEAWTAPLSEFEAGRMPEEARGRQEVILATAITKEGKCRTFQTVFTRNFWGAIHLQETQITDDRPPTYLSPVLAAWGL